MARLIVLSDDWGRHPSASQHLVRQLLPRHPTLWVNTIGMRRPRWSADDARKIAQRLRQWGAWPSRRAMAAALPPNLTVLTPLMWPGFGRTWERRVNGPIVGRQVERALAGLPAPPGERRIVLTTLPIAAAFLDHLPAHAWIYYCVDDFSAWPGLDSEVMRDMERALLRRVDRVITTSAVLHAELTAGGRQVTLLTHGVDVAHWRAQNGTTASLDGDRWPPPWARALRRPIVAFWGLIDRRLDVTWLRALADPRHGPCGSLLLIGPTQGHDAAIESLDGVILPGALPYETLPRVAALADVLVMPYSDSGATRSVQPLKLKEYLSTGKPVVVRSLPETREWADAADVVESAEAFARTVAQRARDGVPATQLSARRQRLLGESWEEKARLLEAIILESA